MSEIQDSAASIAADMRQLADDIAAGRAIVGQSVWRSYADRVEKIGTGNIAKLRELVEDLLYMARRYVKKTPAVETVIFDSKTHEALKTINYHKTIEKAEAALAAPARNCDRFNTGDAERDAEMAWNAITSEMDLQFSDLTDREIAIIKESMRGFVWLFSLADNTKGGEK